MRSHLLGSDSRTATNGNASDGSLESAEMDELRARHPSGRWLPNSDRKPEVWLTAELPPRAG